MSALEQEILDGLKDLNEQAKLCILNMIRVEQDGMFSQFEYVFAPEITITDWLKTAEEMRGSVIPLSSVTDLLDEVRGERLNDLTGGH